MAEDQGEKTEQATDARREEFRKRGQVAHTRELSGALVLIMAALSVYVLGRFFFTNLYELFNYAMGPDLVRTIRQGEYSQVMQFAGLKLILLVLPVATFMTFLGVASSIAQIGFLQVEDALTPNVEKINPLSGIKRIFSVRGMIEWTKSVLKLIGVTLVLYLLLKSEFQQVPQLMSYTIQEIFVYIGSVIYKLFLAIGLISLVLALGDYFFQRLDLEKKMMMTKQEVKEEVKQREGDPMIKARIRRIQRDYATRRMMEQVPKADVIVTNPTHIAVALRYGEDLPAPQVIAKGADLVAEKIKAIAREHNIPIVENKPLARTIYKTLKLGQVIPRELFVAVAEVLSYVYKLKKRKVGRR